MLENQKSPVRLFCGKKHGRGVETCENGDCYEGTFYFNEKEGFGCCKYVDGSSYAGMFLRGFPFGPGVVSYEDDTQDVGLFFGGKLMKLYGTIPLRVDLLKYDKSHKISNTVQCLVKQNHKPRLSDAGQEGVPSSVYKNCLTRANIALNIKEFESDYFQSQYSIDDTDSLSKEFVTLENNSPIFQNMQSHVLRHVRDANYGNYRIREIGGDRKLFSKEGRLEKLSKQFIMDCAENNIRNVNSALLNEQVCLDVCDKQGRTALMYAAVLCNKQIVSRLLKFRADVGRLSDDDRSALLLSFQNYYRESPLQHRLFPSTNELLSAFNTSHSLQLNALQREIIEILLDYGANPNQGSARTFPLYEAVLCGDSEMVRVLLLRNADPNMKNKLSCNLIHLAVAMHVEQGTEITEDLLNAGADVNARVSESGLLEESIMNSLYIYSIIPTAGMTPLHIACSTNVNAELRHKNIALLIKYGAEVDAIWSGNSALSLALSQNNLETADLLMENGASITLDLGLPRSNSLCVLLTSNKIPIHEKISFVKKCLNSEMDILAQVAVENKKSPGTCLDHVYNYYENSKRLFSVPFYTLSTEDKAKVSEFNELVSFLATQIRKKVREVEALRFDQEVENGEIVRSSKARCIYIPTLAKHGDMVMKVLGCAGRTNQTLTFTQTNETTPKKFPGNICYECGRMLVPLFPCNRCREVYFCSTRCKKQGWVTHAEECRQLPSSTIQPKKKKKQGIRKARINKSVKEEADPRITCPIKGLSRSIDNLLSLIKQEKIPSIKQNGKSDWSNNQNAIKVEDPPGNYYFYDNYSFT